MNLRLPILACTAVFLCGLAVLLVPNARLAQRARSVVETAAAHAASAVGGTFGESGDSHAQLLDSAPEAISQVFPAEAAGFRELRINAYRNGVHYGWIQLPRGARVDVIRSQGDWMDVRYAETHFRVHRDVVKAGLVAPRFRSRPQLATLL